MEGERINLTDKEMIILLSKQLEEAFTEIESLKGRVADLEKSSDSSEKIYTGKELYLLKYEENLSWSKLAKRTGKPVSTLQYQIRKYLDEI